MIRKNGHWSSEKIMREKHRIAPETCKAVKPMLGLVARPIAASIGPSS